MINLQDVTKPQRGSFKISTTQENLLYQRSYTCKLAYFSFYGFIGITFPYLNAFFVDIGLSIVQAGYINGFRTLFPLVTSPLIGLLADYTKKRKLILEILLIVTVLIHFSAPWLASLLIKEKNINYHNF